MERPELLPWTENEDANRLLAGDDLALLIGMLLDQQFRMEQAFEGPWHLKERLGGKLDAATIVGMDWQELTDIYAREPVIHRYPGMMAGRTQKLCEALLAEYGGDAGRIWREAEDGRDLLRRLKALPGYGDQKAKIFMAILGRHMGVQPEGWEAVAADWPSIADVFAFEDIKDVRAKKRAAKAAAKDEKREKSKET